MCVCVCVWAYILLQAHKEKYDKVITHLPWVGEGHFHLLPPPFHLPMHIGSYFHILFKSPLVEGRSTRPTSEGQHSPLADRHPLPVPPDPGLWDPAEGQGAPDGDESGGVGGAQEWGGGGDQGEPEAPQEDGGDRRGRRRGETGH